MHNYCFILVILFALASPACREEPIPIPDGLLTDQISSSETADEYLLRIHLPDNYEAVETAYPVLYQLDGETTTGSVLQSYEALRHQNIIDELIIVTIDYVHENKRTRDYTPTFLKEFDESGGAERFLRFLRLELIPHIDRSYRTTSDNTLRGHSLGGLLASYVLFEQDNSGYPFVNFIIESPSWWWDDNYAIGQEYNYSMQYNELNAHVYFSVGAYEPASMKGPFELIRDRMLSRNYDGFQSKFEILTGMDHLDVRENDRGLCEIFGK